MGGLGLGLVGCIGCIHGLRLVWSVRVGLKGHIQQALGCAGAWSQRRLDGGPHCCSWGEEVKVRGSRESFEVKSISPDSAAEFNLGLSLVPWIGLMFLNSQRLFTVS